MESTVEAFIKYLREEKHSSENTWLAYKRDIAQYVTFLKNNDISSFEKTTPKVFSNYIDALTNSGKAASSITRAVAAIRALYRYMGNKNLGDNDPTHELKAIRVEKKPPEGLTSEEIDLLLAQPNGKNFKGVRDKAMLELIYATGIKVTELISLNVDDIDLVNGTVKCTNGARTREIPLHNVAKKAVVNYIQGARAENVKNTNEEALFLNRNGLRITRQGFWKVLKQYQETANIKKDVTPQVLRHSFAIHLLENGADLQSIKEMLGHTDISSTQVYLSSIKSKIHQVYITSHPMAQPEKKEEDFALV